MIIDYLMAHGLGEKPAIPEMDAPANQCQAQLKAGSSRPGKSNPPYQSFGGKRK